jgi:hypothetical protein
MMEYDDQCNMDPTMPPKYPCTHYNIHLATLVNINLYTVIMSQSGDITRCPRSRKGSKMKNLGIK